MVKVRDHAREQGEPVLEALALTALGEAMLKRSGDTTKARDLVDEALELLEGQDDPVAHFDALTVRATIAGWTSDLDGFVRYMERAYAIGLDAKRKDLQTIAAQALAQTHIVRLELDEAELLLMRALELAGESGSVRARVGATVAYAWFLVVKGELDAAETLLEEVRTTSSELGVEPAIVAALAKLGWIARRRGDEKRAEKLLREALHITASRGDRGLLPDLQATLGEVLADVGKVDEAERLALEAEATVSVDDIACRVAVAQALGAVRAAQARDREAEEYYLSAVSLARESEYKVLEIEPLERLVQFLRDRGRENDAIAYEVRLAELSPPPSSTARIA
jgi:tetratricopeptide (TPR) repeat protein